MNLFRDVLKELDRRLDLPQPVKSRVMLEIAADLNDLETHYIDKGLSRDDACKQALEMCDLSDQAIAELVRVHAGGYRRFLERFSKQVQTRLERIFLALLLVVVAAVTGKFVFTARLYETANPMVWPVMAITVACLVFAASRYYAAFLKQDHDSRRLRTGLTWLPTLAGINLLIGFYGYWIGLYSVAREIAGSETDIPTLVFNWLSRGSAMLMVCLLCVIVILMLWYFLVNKVSRIEEAEAALLLAD